MAVRRGALSLLVVILISACGPTSIAASHRGRNPLPAPGLLWRDCGGGFQCGTLQVPLDYSGRSTRKIGLALVRKRATQRSRRIGSLLLNPGGPGASGIEFLRGAAQYFANLNARFDLVSWDPRGVGLSAPVTCVDDAQMDSYLALDPVLDDPSEKATYIQAVKDFAAGCQRRSGDVLPYVDSASTARDMDQIRNAVGDSKLTYLGFSYGTYIGQWYAHLFPTRVRALDLDGVVDSTYSPDAYLRQVRGFDANFQAWRAECTSSPGCAYGRSGDPETKVMVAMARLDVTPLQVGGRQLTRSLAMRGVLVSLYDQSNWKYLDEGLTALDDGDGRLLLFLADYFDGRHADGTYDNLVKGANLAIGCLESYAPTDIRLYDRLGPALEKASPLFGPLFQYSALQCAYWPARSRTVGQSLTVKGAPPILLVGGSNDPATPYVESQSVSKQIPGSVLLTRNGNGHTSYITSVCARTAEDDYLINLTLPAPGTVCSS